MSVVCLGRERLRFIAGAFIVTVLYAGAVQAQGIDRTGESLRFADPSQNFASLCAVNEMRLKEDKNVPIKLL